MKIISHRGNLDGPIFEKENHPDYILNAIDAGFDVEIDLWKIETKLFLGHDEPKYLIDVDFLNKNRKRIWIHSKNLESLHFLLQTNLNFFWHQSDQFTLTSNNYIWTYPDQKITNKSIIVALKYEKINEIPYGICTDYPYKYKNDIIYKHAPEPSL